MLALALLGVAGAIAHAAYHQGSGWIPALAAARDAALMERPHVRPFTAGLEDLSDQLFPWLPLLLVGLLHPGRARWPALWLLAGLVVCSAWSLRYGSLALPLTVPAAVVCAAGLEHLLGARTGAAARRFGLLVVVAGGLILAKDVRRTPSRVGSLLAHGKGEHTYPARELQAPALLGGLALLAALAVVLAAATRRPELPRTRLQRLQAQLPDWLPAALVLAAQLHQAARYGHGLIPRTSEMLSLHRPLTRYAAWHAAGELPGPLAVHRIGDPGVELYGPPGDGRLAVATRDATLALLRGAAPAVALLRTSELAPVFQNSRQAGWPLYVLDASHRDVVLVSNVLPAGAADENPIRRVLRDEPPELAHSTLVRFEDYVEVIGWEWQEPVLRGRETTLQVALRVLRPLPSGSKITFRLQKDRLSRINPLPHDLAEGLYPSQYWRPGDYILHRYTTTVPMLEILPGAHDVVLGLRRSEQANYKISVPEGEQGEPGVTVRGGREFATIGQVQVW